jgi:hypothetical protein
MPLEVQKFLVSDDATVKQPQGSGLKLVAKIKKIVTDLEKVEVDVEGLMNQKNDTANLKNSYKQFVESYNANAGIIGARLDAIEVLLKETVAKLNELDNI